MHSYLRTCVASHKCRRFCSSYNMRHRKAFEFKIVIIFSSTVYTFVFGAQILSILSVTYFFTKWHHTRSHITSYQWWHWIMCNVNQNWNHRSRRREKWKFQQIPTIYSPKFSLRSNYENEYPHFVFLSNMKVRDVWKSEVGSRSTQKAEDIQFHLWNTTFYIFTAVKYNFFKYTLYLINIFLYFIFLYIIKWRTWTQDSFYKPLSAR